MKRKDREITDKTQIEDILKKGNLLNLGLIDENSPYVVPMNYGYSDGKIYLHCAREGHKIDLIRKNPNVCFTVSIDVEVDLDVHCPTTYYMSVAGSGEAIIPDSEGVKVDALKRFMKHYNRACDEEFLRKAVEYTEIIVIDIKSMTGKKNLKHQK